MAVHLAPLALLGLLLAPTPEPPPRAQAPPSSPTIQTPEALTYRSVLARAATSSPGVRAARARAEAAEAAARKARRYPNPELDLRAESFRFTDDPSYSSQRDVDLFATIQQPIPLFGSRTARRDEAAAAARAGRAGFERVRHELTVEAARLYLSAYLGERLVATLTESRDTLDELVEVTRKRVEAGWTAEGDLFKLQAEAARADEQHLRATLERDAAAALLGALLGQDEEVLPRALPEPDLPAPDPLDATGSALEGSPALVNARALRDAARETLRLEKALRLPEPALTAGYKRSQGEDTGVAGLTFLLPIFDGNRGGVERAEALLRGAEAELEGLERKTRVRVTALVTSARAFRERAAKLDETLVRPARESRRAARAAYREGAGTILALVDAERVTVDATRSALDLAGEAHLRTLEARLVSGQEVIP